jgi:cysteine synthase
MSDATEIKTLSATKSWGRGRVYDDIAETIGHTPLVRLARMAKAANVKADILLKLEFFNPLSSVKDRIGVSMIDVLEAQGKITPGQSTLVEPTSGNTGIGLAFVAAARGYTLKLVMPESMSLERRKILAHLGADLVLTPAASGMPGAIEKANELLETLPGAVQPSQFENPANPLVHEKTTAEEIWNDTGGKVDALVVGVGTGGTLTGCPHKLQGIGAGFVPGNLDTTLIDEVITVQNDMAFDVARLLAKVEGIPGGISTGANLAATLTVAGRDSMAGKTIVTFAPSNAERYFSSELFVDPPSEA